jgi:hypothetical protein
MQVDVQPTKDSVRYTQQVDVQPSLHWGYPHNPAKASATVGPEATALSMAQASCTALPKDLREVLACDALHPSAVCWVIRSAHP